MGEPENGSHLGFAAADDFVLAGVRKAINDSVVVNGVNHPVQFIVKDSQSDPNRAADIASSLIKADKVDLIIAAMAPETTNPVADQAELNGVPCITSGTPWQAYFFGRGGKPDKGFDWTYRFSRGIEDCTHLTSACGMPFLPIALSALSGATMAMAMPLPTPSADSNRPSCRMDSNWSILAA